MIKANELRLGNLLNSWEFGRKGKPEPVTPALIELLNDLEEGQEYLGVKPIPLTPDLLEKAGFQQHPDPKDEYSIVINPFGISLIVNVKTQWCALWDHMVQQHSLIALPAKVKYLHQLQNLYFSLTSKELEINL